MFSTGFWGSEQSVLVESVPAHDKGLDLQDSFQPKPFYEAMILFLRKSGCGFVKGIVQSVNLE